MEFKIGSAISKTIDSTLASIAAHRLVKMSGSNQDTVTYNGNEEINPIGKTDMALTATQVSAGFNTVAIQKLTPGQELYLTASGVIPINSRFTAAANGKIKALATNATPVEQDSLGETREASTADGDIIRCEILPGVSVQ